ncbi:preprotein translocase subunit SecE [Gammaproteobacteria bacterium]|nr:preprotein translocase subunit SecE [Gammaproteobacteria bacterium]
MNNWVKNSFAGLLVVAGIVGYYYFADQNLLVRVLSVVAGIIAGLLVFFTSTQGLKGREFLAGSRTELRKVVWPTRKEALQVTLTVIVAVFLISLLLWLFDVMAYKIIYNWILGIA